MKRREDVQGCKSVKDHGGKRSTRLPTDAETDISVFELLPDSHDVCPSCHTEPTSLASVAVDLKLDV